MNDASDQLKEIEDLIFQQFLAIKTAQSLIDEGSAKSLSEAIDRLNHLQVLANYQSTKRSVVIGSLQEIQLKKGGKNDVVATGLNNQTNGEIIA